MHKEVAPGAAALVVLVPEAETLVEPFRSLYDPVAPLGMPAHVTIMFPFRALPDLSGESRARLAERLASVEPFRYEFASTGVFPGVLYLRPEDEAPFLRLTALVRSVFPELTPYGDPHLKQTPHLTVAHATSEARLQEIRTDFEKRLRDHGPVTGLAPAVALLEHGGSAWVHVDSIKLGEDTL